MGRPTKPTDDLPLIDPDPEPAALPEALTGSSEPARDDSRAPSINDGPFEQAERAGQPMEPTRASFVDAPPPDAPDIVKAWYDPPDIVKAWYDPDVFVADIEAHVRQSHGLDPDRQFLRKIAAHIRGVAGLPPAD